MHGELFPKILSGGLRLPHELLGSEKFQTATATTRQGWCLTHVLEEHEFETLGHRRRAYGKTNIQNCDLDHNRSQPASFDQGFSTEIK
jgi:hypothetical protein